MFAEKNMNGHHLRYDSSLGKLLFLVAISMLLSTLGPLSLLSPAPLVLAFFLYGNKKTYVMTLAFSVILFAITSYGNLSVMNLAAFLLSIVYALIVKQIIINKQHPMVGVIKYGFYLLGVTLGAFLLWQNLFNGSLSEELLKVVQQVTTEISKGPEYNTLLSKGGNDVRELQDFIKDPSKVVSEIMNWIPSIVFITIFLTIWSSLFLVLRNSLVWSSKVSYPYSINELIKFQLPEYLIWPLILGLSLAVGGEYLGGEIFEIIGFNILYCLGVFYFFQGFGILLLVTAKYKVSRFLRNMIIMFVTLTAWKVLVIVGLVGQWFNFNKFIKQEDK
jgi:hypothetical protein